MSINCVIKGLLSATATPTTATQTVRLITTPGDAAISVDA